MGLTAQDSRDFGFLTSWALAAQQQRICAQKAKEGTADTQGWYLRLAVGAPAHGCSCELCRSRSASVRSSSMQLYTQRLSRMHEALSALCMIAFTEAEGVSHKALMHCMTSHVSSS